MNNRRYRTKTKPRIVEDGKFYDNRYFIDMIKPFSRYWYIKSRYKRDKKIMLTLDELMSRYE